MRLAISPAAAGLLRALTARSGLEANRILLIACRSVDWQSLTFVGERHQLHLRFTGAGARIAARRMCAGLAEAEFTIPRVIVADIALVGGVRGGADGSAELKIEALTIVSD